MSEDILCPVVLLHHALPTYLSEIYILRPSVVKPSLCNYFYSVLSFVTN